MRAYARIMPGRPAHTTRVVTPNCPKCGRYLHIQIVVHGEYDGLTDTTWSEEWFNCECGFRCARNDWGRAALEVKP